MKTLIASLTLLFVAGCASPPAPQATAQQYPDWLEMKTGYAETCIKGGGCVPMTQGELQQMASEIMQRALQACRRLPST